MWEPLVWEPLNFIAATNSCRTFLYIFYLVSSYTDLLKIQRGVSQSDPKVFKANLEIFGIPRET